MKVAAALCRALSILILLAVLIVYLPLAIPSLFDVDTYAVISGSMEPIIKVGSLVYSKGIDPNELDTGDIIVFRHSDAETPVTHRVMENHPWENKIITKGDANEDVDFRPVEYQNVLGKVIFSVPYLGITADFASGMSGKAAGVMFLLVSVLLGILSDQFRKSCKAGPNGERSEKKGKNSSGVRALGAVFLGLTVAVGCFGAYKVYASSTVSKQEDDANSEMKQYLEMPAQTAPQPEPTVAPPVQTVTPRPKSEAPQVDFEIPQVDFEKMKADGYKDVVGWIYIPDTPVNYPVFFDGENDFYLHHNGLGEYSHSGAIFLDERNYEEFSDTHNILYGHHMADGSMFAGLRKYKEPDFIESHRFGALITPEGTRIIEFFAGHVANVEEPSWEIEYDGEEGYAEWLANEVEKSCFETELKPLTGDSVITLSTCSYEFDNARFILHGVLFPYMPKIETEQ